MNQPAISIPSGAYLVFGLPGTGKSTIAKALRDTGYIAIDTDADIHLSNWVNIVTGQPLTSRPGFPFTQTWRNTHRWRWDATRFNQLLPEPLHHAVFFCGDADNIEDFFPKFRQRFGLFINNQTMTRRLTSRDPKRWNNTNSELKETLDWNSAFVDTWQSDYVHLIDANRPTQSIVSDIIKQAAI